MTATSRPPRCAITGGLTIAWRVTVSLPDGSSGTLPLLTTTRIEAALLAAELAGPGSLVRRVERQGEWA